MTKDEKIKLYEELMEDKDFLHEMNKREQADLKYMSEMAYREEKGFEQGKKEGFEIGFKQSFEQAMKEGFEQARKKGELNIAKNLKSLDMSVDDIAKVTNLSIDEIKKL